MTASGIMKDNAIVSTVVADGRRTTMIVVAHLKDSTEKRTEILNVTRMIDAIVEAKKKYTDEELKKVESWSVEEDFL